VEGHQLEILRADTRLAQRARVARTQPRQSGHRKDYLARSGRPVDLGDALQPPLEQVGVALVEVVADQRPAEQAADLSP
jgi:hypothetical protein